MPVLPELFRVLGVHLRSKLLLFAAPPCQTSGRHLAPGSHLRRSHETFSMEADKKEKTRHNQFIKTAQPYKPKVKQPRPPGGKQRLSRLSSVFLAGVQQ